MQSEGFDQLKSASNLPKGLEFILSPLPKPQNIAAKPSTANAHLSLHSDQSSLSLYMFSRLNMNNPFPPAPQPFSISFQPDTFHFMHIVPFSHHIYYINRKNFYVLH